MKEIHFLSDEAKSSLPHFLSEARARFGTYRRLHRKRSLEITVSRVLDSLPSLTELDYRELSRELLTQRSGDRFMSDVTTGTTGHSKIRISTHRDEAAEADLSRRYFRHLEIGKGDRVVALDIDSSDIYNFYGMVFLQLEIDTFLFEAVGPDCEISGWHLADPTIIVSVPSLLFRLLPAIRRERAQGHIRNLQKIICIGEPIESQLRIALEDELGVECFSFYGCTETGSLAGECRLHRGLHVLDDRVVLSLRVTAESGRTGELLWTTLHLKDHPVVKYESGDVGTVISDKCGCGLPGPVLTGIRRGRDHFSLFGHQFDYRHISDSVGEAIGAYGALQIEIDDGKRPRFRFLLPRALQSHSDAITRAVMHAEDFGYFVERGFVDWELDFDDALVYVGRKARRVVDKRSPCA